MKQIKIENKYLSLIAKLFAPSILDAFAKTGSSPYLNEVFSSSGLTNKIDTSITLSNFFNLIYDYLRKVYRNEYIYKNILTNKFFQENHKSENARILTEFRVGKSIADVVILNGTSTVYEIKSQFDSFRRIQGQVNTYLKIFNNVNVITTENQVNNLIRLIPEEVGIQILEGNDEISVFRNAKCNVGSIDYEVIFNSLRKNEYLTIIKNYFGFLPEVPNTKIFSECLILFKNIPLNDLSPLVINVLKERSNSGILHELFEDIPYSLNAYFIGTKRDRSTINKLVSLFDVEVKHLFI